MGSYTGPSLALNYLKIVVDNTNTTGQIVLGPHKVGFGMYYLVSSALFDGIIGVQIQDSSGNFNTSGSINGANKQQALVFSGNDNLATGFDVPYPYNVQITVDTAPTLGVATIYWTYFIPPANPLF